MWILGLKGLKTSVIGPQRTNVCNIELYLWQFSTNYFQTWQLCCFFKAFFSSFVDGFSLSGSSQTVEGSIPQQLGKLFMHSLLVFNLQSEEKFYAPWQQNM